MQCGTAELTRGGGGQVGVEMVLPYCWAGGGLLTLISLTMKSDLHSSRTKLQAWPMNMGNINDFKNFLNYERFIIL